ncbi:MAG: glycosyltransferase [Pirellulaceae bacterium]
MAQSIVAGSRGVPRVSVLFLLGTLASGGSERQVVETLKAIDRRRFRPVLYSVYREGDLWAEVPADVPLHSYWDQHTPPWINLPGTILRRQARHLRSVLHRESIEVVCERNFAMTLLSARAVGSRVPRIAFIGSDPQRDLAQNAGRFGWLKKRYLGRAYRAAHCVVCVSDGVAQAASAFYGLQQVSTIHNFVDLERIARLAAEYRPPYEPERFHVVVVGRLHAAKGHTVLLAAVDELVHRRNGGRVVVWLVGRGPLQTELERQVKQYRLEDHVRFVGHQPNPLPYMRDASLLCLPSLYEGLPNVLVEAMACGTPVLATDCQSGPAEILLDGKLGALVPVGDATALAAGLADAMAHHGTWTARTAAARQHIVEHYSLEAGMAAIETLITSAAEHARQAEAGCAGGESPCHTGS